MGRSPERNQQARDERREKILSTALRLFATRGLAATRISDIAGAAEMSQGLLYCYFPNKEAIFTTLIADAFERMNAACRMLEGLPLSPLEKVELAVARLIEGLEQHADTALYHLLIAQATASDAIPDEAKAIIREQGRTPYEVMARIFAAGQRQRVFVKDPPDMQALTFWTAIKGISIHRAAHGAGGALPTPGILMRMFIVPQPAQDRATKTNRSKK